MRLREDANRSAEQLLNRINRAEEAQRQETLRQKALALFAQHRPSGRSAADLRSSAEIEQMYERREALLNQAAAHQRVLDQHDALHSLQRKVQRLKSELSKNNADLKPAETPPAAVIQSLPKNGQWANSVAWSGGSSMLLPFRCLCLYYHRQRCFSNFWPHLWRVWWPFLGSKDFRVYINYDIRATDLSFPYNICLIVWIYTLCSPYHPESFMIAPDARFSFLVWFNVVRIQACCNPISFPVPSHSIAKWIKLVCFVGLSTPGDLLPVHTWFASLSVAHDHDGTATFATLAMAFRKEAGHEVEMKPPYSPNSISPNIGRLIWYPRSPSMGRRPVHHKVDPPTLFERAGWNVDTTGPNPTHSIEFSLPWKAFRYLI